MIRVSNSLDPDQARCFIWPDLDPNCLHGLLLSAVFFFKITFFEKFFQEYLHDQGVKRFGS